MSSSGEGSDVSHRVEAREDSQNNENDEGEQSDERNENAEASEDSYYDADDDSGEDSDDLRAMNTYRGKMENLTRLRSNVNWEVEEERARFFSSFRDIVNDWNIIGIPPNFREIFSTLEIDWLLAEDLRNSHENDGRIPIITFALMSGYRDAAEYGEDGQPLLRRATAVHQAGRRRFSELVENLFKIYHIRDANYSDDTGLTHFHVACKSRCYYVVVQFLEAGQDPNCLWRETGDTPLHLALASGCRFVAELLLVNGADPKLTNARGSTPLHVVCEESGVDYLAEIFFNKCDDLQETLQVDARNNLGRTPLQLAVANFMPNTVELLVNRGADLTSFVFPTESYFGARFLSRRSRDAIEFKLELASGPLAVAKCLGKRGYRLNRSDALLIMRWFSRHELFKKSARFAIDAADMDMFAEDGKQHMIDSRLSLYRAVTLHPEAAEQHDFDFALFLNLACTYRFTCLSVASRETCVLHLCEAMSRRFFCSFALDPLYDLTRCRIPVVCCKQIIKYLWNVDLWNVCSAVTGQ